MKYRKGLACHGRHSLCVHVFVLRTSPPGRYIGQYTSGDPSQKPHRQRQKTHAPSITRERSGNDFVVRKRPTEGFRLGQTPSSSTILSPWPVGRIFQLGTGPCLRARNARTSNVPWPTYPKCNALFCSVLSCFKSPKT
jgi:hypothetical protein